MISPGRKSINLHLGHFRMFNIFLYLLVGGWWKFSSISSIFYINLFFYVWWNKRLLYHLVGGDWNMNPFSWECHNPNWRLFFRGVQTTNQSLLICCFRLLFYIHGHLIYIYIHIYIYICCRASCWSNDPHPSAKLPTWCCVGETQIPLPKVYCMVVKLLYGSQT